MHTYTPNYPSIYLCGSLNTGWIYVRSERGEYYKYRLLRCKYCVNKRPGLRQHLRVRSFIGSIMSGAYITCRSPGGSGERATVLENKQTQSPWNKSPTGLVRKTSSKKQPCLHKTPVCGFYVGLLSSVGEHKALLVYSQCQRRVIVTSTH